MIYWHSGSPFAADYVADLKGFDVKTLLVDLLVVWGFAAGAFDVREKPRDRDRRRIANRS